MSRAKVLYERQIRIVDTHRLVYDLYGLTEEEVRVIERGGVGKFRSRSKITYLNSNIYQIPTTFLDKSNNSILDVKNGVSN
jgi:hypothetical protein